jgi:hypothetical protein
LISAFREGRIRRPVVVVGRICLCVSHGFKWQFVFQLRFYRLTKAKSDPQHLTNSAMMMMIMARLAPWLCQAFPRHMSRRWGPILTYCTTAVDSLIPHVFKTHDG